MSIVLQGSTSGSVTLQEPAVAGTTVLTLPAVSGTVLTSASAISASSITTGTLPKAQLPTGSVLQVVSTTKTDTTTTTTTSYADITGMSVNITPTNSLNKVLVFAKLSIAPQAGTNRAAIRLVRESTAIFIGDAAGSRVPASSSATAVNSDQITDLVFVFLDSPATTSATTYKVQWQTTGAGTIGLNRSISDVDSNAYFRTASSITVMEIAG